MSTTISSTMVKELREKTGAGILDCRNALVDANGDIENAIILLREKGILSAEKKASRETTEGRIESYIHFGGKLGVLIEVNCETDFVAKTDEFKQLAKDLAMHIAASNPTYISREDIPETVLEREREIYRKQAQREGKPSHIIERIIAGKLEKFYQTVCFLHQPYIKEPEKSVEEVIKEAIARLGENIVVRKFARFVLGEKE